MGPYPIAKCDTITIAGNDPYFQTCWDNDAESFQQIVHKSIREDNMTNEEIASWTKLALKDVEKLDRLRRYFECKVDNEGNTCLHIAAYRNSYKVLEWVLACLGVQHPLLNVANHQGMTALHLACRYKENLKVVTSLIKYEADVNAEDADGMKPIHFAATVDSTEMIDIFQFYKKNIDVRTHLGITPLFIACRDNFVDMALKLVSLGADITARNTMHHGVHSVTPLIIARAKGWDKELLASCITPQQPKPPVVEVHTDRVTKLVWEPAFARCAPVEYYKVEVRQIDSRRIDLDWRIVSSNCTKTTYTFETCRSECSTFERDATPEDLEPSEVYQVRISAYSMIGWSVPSEASNPFLTGVAAPVRPQPPRIVATTNSSITIEWDNPESNGLPIDLAEIQWRLSGSATMSWNSLADIYSFERPEIGDEASSSESESEEQPKPQRTEKGRYRMNGLDVNGLYKFRVRVHNAVGWSYYSDASKSVQPHNESRRVRRDPVKVVHDTSLDARNFEGMESHAKARMYTMQRVNIEKEDRGRNDVRDEALGQEAEKRRLAITRIQTMLRSRWASRKFQKYLEDRKKRKLFLKQYNLQEKFDEEWRGILMQFKNVSLNKEAVLHQKKENKLQRKIERNERRRERRQIAQDTNKISCNLDS